MPTLNLHDTMERLLLNIRSGHPLIYIVSHEEDRVFDYLTRLVRVLRLFNPRKQFLRWDAGDLYQKLDVTDEFEQAYMRECQHLKKEPLNPLSEVLQPNQEWRQETGRVWLKIDGGILERKGQVTWKSVNMDAQTTLNNARTQSWSDQPEMGDSILAMLDIHTALMAQNFGGSLVRPLRNTAAALRRYYEEQRDLHRQDNAVNRFYPRAIDGEPQPFPYKTIIIVAPSKAGLSRELERDMIVCDFPLPEEDELLDKLQSLMEGPKPILAIETPGTPEEYLEVVNKISGPGTEVSNESNERVYESRLKDLVAGGGRGLTLDAFKHGINGYAVRGEKLSPHHVNEMLNLKASFINNDALQYTPNVKVPLGGLKMVRDWVAARRDPACYEAVREQYRLPPLNGVMLCGGSGTGKSMLAKLIAQEFNLALLRLDVGALFGSYIGESEQRTRDALNLAEVLAPIVLWIDECDKAFSGMNDGGDNGVSARVFGTFLTWLAEKRDSVFVVATANDFRALFDKYPEFSRKGRFDEIFWIDLPGQDARQQIFEIYMNNALKDNARISFTQADVARVIAQSGVPFVQQTSESPIVSLTKILANDILSNRMTGAEIEYYVKDLMYEFYNRDRIATNETNAALVLRVLEGARGRALYDPQGQLANTYGEMQAEAQQKGWPFVR